MASDLANPRMGSPFFGAAAKISKNTCRDFISNGKIKAVDVGQFNGQIFSIRFPWDLAPKSPKP